LAAGKQRVGFGMVASLEQHMPGQVQRVAQAGEVLDVG
jgi:hypothetical protein